VPVACWTWHSEQSRDRALTQLVTETREQAVHIERRDIAATIAAFRAQERHVFS
jgi:hypothetical protein